MIGRLVNLLKSDGNECFSLDHYWEPEAFDYPGLKMRRLSRHLPGGLKLYAHLFDSAGATVPPEPFWHGHSQPTAMIISPIHGALKHYTLYVGSEDSGDVALTKFTSRRHFAYEHTHPKLRHAVVVEGMLPTVMLVQAKGEFTPTPVDHEVLLEVQIRAGFQVFNLFEMYDRRARADRREQ